MKFESPDQARARIPFRHRKSLEELLAPIQSRLHSTSTLPKPVLGFSTGFSKLDELTHGLSPGNLVVVAGFPSSGRTSFCVDIAVHLGCHGGFPVVVFLRASSGAEFALKLLSNCAGIDQELIRTERLNSGDLQRVEACLPILSKAPIFVCDSRELNLGDVAVCTELVQRQYGRVAVAIVDCHDTLATAEASLPPAERHGLVSSYLRELAETSNVPVVLTSLLRRNFGSIPAQGVSLAQLEGNGPIEADANAIWILENEGKELPCGKLSTPGKVIVAKNNKGRTGQIDFDFLPSISRWEEVLPPSGVYEPLCLAGGGC